MAKGKKRKRPGGHPARTAKTAPPRQPGTEDERPALSPRAMLAAVVLLVVVGVGGYLAFGSGGETEEQPTAAPEDLPVPWVDSQGQTPIVGAVDLNPADKALWLATNTGLWRVAADADRPEQVTGQLTTDAGSGDISEQLIVRFRGPDRMIASGHPPANSDLPPALGMIESRDAGKTWSAISGLGKNDFHAIQLSGDSIVAGVFGAAAVNVSNDGGKTFEQRAAPDPLVDLEADPDSPSRLIASTQSGLITSADGGQSWRTRDPIPNVRFAWPTANALYRIDPGGPVKISADGGQIWKDRGSTGGEPQAMYADGPDHLFVALIDGTVKESDDGGKSWTDRVTPPA